jgi:hypothetical protein
MVVRGGGAVRLRKAWQCHIWCGCAGDQGYDSGGKPNTYVCRSCCCRYRLTAQCLTKVWLVSDSSHDGDQEPTTF